jgi:hypothetical protein
MTMLPIDAGSTARSVSLCPPGPDHAVAPSAHHPDPGPNDFHLSLHGPDPDLAVGGTHAEQEYQRDQTVRLAAYAAASYESRWIPGSFRYPDDAEVSRILAGLKPNAPIGEDGREVTHAVYSSQVPNATPQQVFDHWVQHPNEVFNAGGMEIRPPTSTLRDGRYMLETGGTNAPPTWLPVEIKVDAARRAINIKTLDGHVLRGEQTFYFRDNGCGGTAIEQDARFQASSKLVGDMQKFLPISQGQHTAWQNAHRESYEQFNGDRGYRGIGIPLVDPVRQLEALGGQALGQIVSDPGRAADAGIDSLGDLGNLGLDFKGRIEAWAADRAGGVAHWTLDRLGLPGGAQAEQLAHDAGQVLDAADDTLGDWVQAGADKAGDAAKTVVDALNPFN